MAYALLIVSPNPAFIPSVFQNRPAFGLPSSRFSVSFVCSLIRLPSKNKRSGVLVVSLFLLHKINSTISENIQGKTTIRTKNELRSILEWIINQYCVKIDKLSENEKIAFILSIKEKK